MKSLFEEPRNKAQVYSARKHCTGTQDKDEIFLIEKLKTM